MTGASNTPLADWEWDGAAARLRRVYLGLSQGEIAKRAGVGQVAVSKWERNLSSPDADVLPRYAAALELDSFAPLYKPREGAAA